MASTATSYLIPCADSTLGYKATKSGDLGRMFEIFKIYPEIAVRITQLTLDEDLDGPYHSGILDFADEYGTTPEVAPFGEDDYESAAEDSDKTVKEFDAKITPEVCNGLDRPHLVGLSQDDMTAEDCDRWEDFHDPMAPGAEGKRASTRQLKPLSAQLSHQCSQQLGQ